MPVPSPRFPALIARGLYADLLASISDLSEGELCFAEDQKRLYIKQAGSLEIASISALGTFLDTFADVDINAIGAPQDGSCLIYQDNEWVAGPVIGGVSYVGPEDDPYFNNVIAGLKFEGANNSNVFTNYRNNGVVFSVKRGSPIISTNQFKYGTSSGYFTSDQIAAETLSVPPTGTFTLEAWFYFNSFSFSGDTLFFIGPDSYFPYWVNVQLNSSKRLTATHYWNGGLNVRATQTDVLNIQTGQWYHIAYEMLSGNVYYYLNGVRIFTNWQYTPDFGTNNAFIYLGARRDTSYLVNAYIDDFRYTRGVSRYNGQSFTPPLSLPTKGPTTSVYSVNNLADVDVQNVTSLDILQQNNSGSFVNQEIRLKNQTIATSNEPGFVGQMYYDSNYLYMCVAANVWTRTPLVAW